MFMFSMNYIKTMSSGDFAAHGEGDAEDSIVEEADGDNFDMVSPYEKEGEGVLEKESIQSNVLATPFMGFVLVGLVAFLIYYMFFSY